MAKSRLTKKQRQLVADVKRLISTLGLDPEEIAEDAEPEARTTYLELAKDQITRSAVLLKYVLIDELLSAVMCWHYFGKSKHFSARWKTKRFKSFNYFIVERLYLLQKLDLVKYVHDIPRWVASDVAALNELRNGIAHSFFPQNRRRKPEWKGQSVFTNDGFDRFLDDMQKLTDFFVQRFFARSWEAPTDRPDQAVPPQKDGGA
jgi:hypothetical protein